VPGPSVPPTIQNQAKKIKSNWSQTKNEAQLQDTENNFRNSRLGGPALVECVKLNREKKGTTKLSAPLQHKRGTHRF